MSWVTRFQAQFGIYTKLNYHFITNSHFEIAQFSQYQGLLASGKKETEQKVLYLILYLKQIDWGPLHMARGFLFYIRPKKTLDFPIWCLLKSLTRIHFLPSLVPVSFFFNCSIFRPLSLSLSDVLAALYNLCFFWHSLPWALLNQWRLQRLDEVLTRIFSSIVDLRGSLLKSVPLDFGLDKTFALYFCHQHYRSILITKLQLEWGNCIFYCHSQQFIAGWPLAAKICNFF